MLAGMTGDWMTEKLGGRIMTCEVRHKYDFCLEPLIHRPDGR